MKVTTPILTLLITLAGLPCHSEGVDSADADYCIDWGDGKDIFDTKLVLVKKRKNIKAFKIPRNRQARSTCISYSYSVSPSFYFIDKSGREVFNFEGGFTGGGWGGGIEITYRTSIALDSGGKSDCVSSTRYPTISAKELEENIKIDFTDSAGLWESAIKNVKKKDILRLKGKNINGDIKVSVHCQPDLDTTYQVGFRAKIIGECKSDFLKGRKQDRRSCIRQ